MPAFFCCRVEVASRMTQGKLNFSVSSAAHWRLSEAGQIINKFLLRSAQIDKELTLPR